MIKAMYSGVSGMKANQTKLDVIGNNVANAGTTSLPINDVAILKAEFIRVELLKAKSTSSFSFIADIFSKVAN
ncbi:flagellar basal body protein, partial [Clostridioides difficile]|uniref:flagellar basal body protein n=1 Tax=Clostridioides difficile TaxID=1496 RepID=UPI001EEE384A